jgi:hypothetical protein
MTSPDAYRIKLGTISIIVHSSIATCFIICVKAPKIQDLIPLVFPLKIKGEKSWLLHPLCVREGWGGIGFWSFAMDIYLENLSGVINLLKIGKFLIILV